MTHWFRHLFDFEINSARRIWNTYYANVDAVVFLIDVSDRSRFQESAEALRTLLDCEELSYKPFVILGNKIDKPEAASEEELRDCIDLPIHKTYGKEYIPGKKAMPIEVFMCSIINRTGYKPAFLWLSNFLQDA